MQLQGLRGVKNCMFHRFKNAVFARELNDRRNDLEADLENGWALSLWSEPVVLYGIPFVFLNFTLVSHQRCGKASNVRAKQLCNNKSSSSSNRWSSTSNLWFKRTRFVGYHFRLTVLSAVVLNLDLIEPLGFDGAVSGIIRLRSSELQNWAKLTSVQLHRLRYAKYQVKVQRRRCWVMRITKSAVTITASWSWHTLLLNHFISVIQQFAQVIMFEAYLHCTYCAAQRTIVARVIPSSVYSKENAVVSKLLLPMLAWALRIAVQTINHVWERPLNHRIFMQLYVETESQF